MSSQKVKDFCKTVEETYHKFDFGYADLFRQAADNGDYTDEDAKFLEYEFIIFRFMTIDSFRQPGRKRFAPAVTYTNGAVFPDIKLVTDEQMAYYRERAEVCENPVMKARYLDFLYEHDSQTNKFQIAPALVDSYLDASNVMEHDNEIERIDCLSRAFVISKTFSKQIMGIHEKVVDKITLRLEELRKTNIRWCLELMEIVYDQPGSFSNEAKQLCVDIAEEGIRHYTEQDNNFNLRGHFVELKNKFQQMSSPESFDPKDAAKEKAQTLIDEAEKRTDSGIVQQHFYMEAFEILKKAGLSADANELIKKVEAIGNSDTFEKEFQSFSVDVPLPPEMFEEVRQALMRAKDKGAYIGLSKNFITSWEDAVKDSQEGLQSVTDMLFNSTHISSRGVPISAEADKELRGATRYYEAQAQFKQIILQETVGKLIDEGKLTKADVMANFAKIQPIDDDTFKSIEKGLDLFFAGEHFAAVMILVTQFENMLLCMLPQVFDTPQHSSTRDGKGLQPKMLSTILDDIQSFIGDDIHKDFEYIFIDPLGMNLRNLVAHGELKVTHANRLFGLLVIHAYLRILARLVGVKEP